MRPSRVLLIAVVAAVAAAATAFAATRSIDASSAARLTLTEPSARGTGWSVAKLGDINHDGRPDIAIGAPFTSVAGQANTGVVYVVFGSDASGTVAPGEQGFQIVGGKSYRAGYGVAAAGDVNGDGRPDILLSAPRKGVRGYKTPGSAYVIFGKTDRAPVDLTRLTPQQGFEIVGIVPNPAAAPDQIAGVGDINRDSYADVMVAEGYYGLPGPNYRGGADVIYGSEHPRRVDLRRLGTRGFHITTTKHGGPPALAAAGDVNGDRRPDLLLGVAKMKVAGKRFPANSAFVVFGRHYARTVDLRRLGARGFRIGGLVPARIYAPEVAGIGDINGDRRADVLLVRDPGGELNGKAPEAAVVFGSRSTRTVDAGRLGGRGFRIVGEAIRQHFNNLGPVAGLGDLNGDRLPDFALGAAVTRTDGESEQSAFVVYGRRGTSTLRLGNLGAAGFKLTGPAPTPECGAPGVGFAMAGAGDFDGDGRGDLLLGVPRFGDCHGAALVVPAP